MAAWMKPAIGGVVLDICGVLYTSGVDGGSAITGSVDAVDRLKKSGIPVRFCTNETTTTRKGLVDKLRRFGFTINEEEVFPPVPAVCKILKQRNLRPHLLVDPEVLPDFDDVDKSNPNCVVMGDATSNFTYDNLNKTFQALMAMDNPLLFSLGKGRFYRQDDQLVLDVGPFMKALEYACDIEAEVVGKPSPIFFNTLLQDMGLTPDKVVMVGDDIVSDVGGAQACQMRGIQVRTGKFRPQDENHPTVKPNGFVNNLAEFVDILLTHHSHDS